MEEEEEEQLRQELIIQEPDPEEARDWEHKRRLDREREKEQEGVRVHQGRISRGHRRCRTEPDQDWENAHLCPGLDTTTPPEEGRQEEEEYGNDGKNTEVIPRLKPTMRPIAAASAAPSASLASCNLSPNTPGDESPCGIIIPHENSPPNALPQDDNRPRIGLSLKLGESFSHSK